MLIVAIIGINGDSLPRVVNQKQQLVFDLVGGKYAAKCETAAPWGSFFRAHGVEYFTKLFGFIVAVTVRGPAGILVKFFVIEILNVACRGFKHALLFTFCVCSIAAATICCGSRRRCFT